MKTTKVYVYRQQNFHADPNDKFSHSRMGNMYSFSPEMIAYAKQLIPEPLWGDFRQRIAGVRSGVPGADAPRSSEVPGYKNKTPEDQRFTQWILQSLLTGRPREDLGMSFAGKTSIPGDELLDESRRLAGGR